MDYKYIEDQKRVVALDGEDEVGLITYSILKDDVWAFDHTYVDPQYRGGSIAGDLLEKLVSIARDQDKKILPQCSYVVRKFANNPSYQELEYKE